MALTDFIGIRGLNGEEPFQGIGGGSATADSSATTDSTDSTDAPIDGTESTVDWGDLPGILEKALLYTDEAGDLQSILKKALLYSKGMDGEQVIASILNDRLSDLAFVDAVLDFGFMRVLIKGKMIEYAK